MSYNSGQTKVKVRPACNDRATMIVQKLKMKSTEKRNEIRRTHFITGF